MFSRFTIALFVLASLTVPARAQEFQSWNEIDITASWRNLDVAAPFIASVDPSSSKRLFVATGFTADCRLPRHLTLTVGYLYADLPVDSVHANAPLIAVSESVGLGRLTISDRNRLEKLIGLGKFGTLVGLGASPWRYRNRALFDPSLGNSARWHAFADDEVFYDFALTP